jgi:hypothetical protein
MDERPRDKEREHLGFSLAFQVLTNAEIIPLKMWAQA